MNVAHEFKKQALIDRVIFHCGVCISLKLRPECESHRVSHRVSKGVALGQCNWKT